MPRAAPKRLGATKPRRPARSAVSEGPVVGYANTPARGVALAYLAGRGLYERILRDALPKTKVSVWIATANLKEVLVEAPAALRVGARAEYVASLDVLAMLARRGVEVRLLHSGLPSQAFARSMLRHRALLRPRGDGTAPLTLRRCPRVHFKTVVVDGALAYLGSANWTGAGLGAKGAGRRNFELGFVTEDHQVLDDVQALFDEIWRGAACRSCALRAQCPAPIDEYAR